MDSFLHFGDFVNPSTKHVSAFMHVMRLFNQRIQQHFRWPLKDKIVSLVHVVVLRKVRNIKIVLGIPNR